MNPQRVVEDCMAAIFDDLSVHPSGAITGYKKGFKVQVFPRRIKGELESWAYVFSDRHGNETVAGNTAGYEQVMIGRIQRWAWSL